MLSSLRLGVVSVCSQVQVCQELLSLRMACSLWQRDAALHQPAELAVTITNAGGHARLANERCLERLRAAVRLHGGRLRVGRAVVRQRAG